jgi:hypothetical protein
LFEHALTSALRASSMSKRCWAPAVQEWWGNSTTIVAPIRVIETHVSDEQLVLVVEPA